jgi:hypothetical protein
MKPPFGRMCGVVPIVIPARNAVGPGRLLIYMFPLFLVLGSAILFLLTYILRMGSLQAHVVLRYL